MCGIFGIISDQKISNNHLNVLASHARQRGKDSSGLIFLKDKNYVVKRADYDIKKLLKKVGNLNVSFVMGHSRLITNGLADNQPVVRDGICVIHNGIIVNDDDVWKELSIERKFQIDSEAIIGIALEHLSIGGAIDEIPSKVIDKCIGTISCAIAIPHLGKALLFSNNGSLYSGSNNKSTYFASERYPLETIECDNVVQIMHQGIILDIPISEQIDVSDDHVRSENLIPVFQNLKQEESMLLYPAHNLTRCTKCLLPSTMPYIRFDAEGVCNYCKNYKLRNVPKPKEELFKIVEPYRRLHGQDCIVPFSGGRDSCYGLHLIVDELKMKPITYTYDWGMVTDLGRRNISRMCAELGVENIIIADDISMKRRNIALNLKAWLKSPHLGMISILTAGDKHFFRHVETVKKQTGIKLNLWGVNPLEVTHFKSGFLGIKPDFEEERVYAHGISKQLHYQKLRFKAMLQSPGYFNSSLWDTISGEYYRSFTEIQDYFHIFDFWRWDEGIVDNVLDSYDWEKAPDTNTTWRIGDGTAAFYNYLYYLIAGFTEHDTFRSNQIREGQISREEALVLVEDENRPRYQNIRWYLDALGMDFKEVIGRINNIPRLY
jgi:predicted glutamine amidotransferase/DNA-binding ferritin-like protein (Dps family)